MKRFSLITETEARCLAIDEVVELAPGGHVTPLAEDTLRSRRVRVVRGGVDPDAAARLGLETAVRRVAVGADHVGRELIGYVVRHLRARGLAVSDLTPIGADPIDYPDVAAAVARAVTHGEADAGVVADGSGIGSAVAANKVAGIRAAVLSDVTVARYGREHVGVNVGTLAATLVTPEEVATILDAWLGATIREPRYIARLVKIARLEERS